MYERSSFDETLKVSWILLYEYSNFSPNLTNFREVLARTLESTKIALVSWIRAELDDEL